MKRLPHRTSNYSHTSNARHYCIIIPYKLHNSSRLPTANNNLNVISVCSFVYFIWHEMYMICSHINSTLNKNVWYKFANRWNRILEHPHTIGTKLTSMRAKLFSLHDQMSDSRRLHRTCWTRNRSNDGRKANRMGSAWGSCLNVDENTVCVWLVVEGW